jgi:hypothetical protein
MNYFFPAGPETLWSREIIGANKAITVKSTHSMMNTVAANRNQR